MRRGNGRTIMNLRSTICATFLSALMPATAGLAEPPKLPVPAFDQSAVGQRGYFYVGGTYIGEDGKNIMRGQAYVEVVAPKDVRHPYPLVSARPAVAGMSADRNVAQIAHRRFMIVL